MKVATILPTPLLGLEPSTEYNMCLYQVLKESPEYYKYFKKLKDKGQFVIMDNGAAEGVNPAIEDLLLMYESLRPSEAILPDVVYDKEETLRRTKEAYIAMCENNMHQWMQYMAVPQGNNYTEWVECMSEMMQQRFITTIGVSKFVTPKFQTEMGYGANVRLECVDAILTEAAKRQVGIQIHLLGCWDDPKEIGQIHKAFGSNIRGTDSAIAYVHARAGNLYASGDPRPDNDEIDFISGTVADKNTLKFNMVAWLKECNNC